jgi:hypothetical protein
LVSHVKYHGETFDDRLSRRLHIEMIEAKAFRTYIRINFLFKLIGNRTRDLPACTIAPQPTTLPTVVYVLTSLMHFVTLKKLTYIFYSVDACGAEGALKLANVARN